MPCFDERIEAERSNWSELATVKKALSQTQAMLCGLLRRLEAVGMLDVVLEHDEKTSGVTREQIMKWFADHKAAEGLAAAERPAAAERGANLTAPDLA